MSVSICESFCWCCYEDHVYVFVESCPSLCSMWHSVHIVHRPFVVHRILLHCYITAFTAILLISSLTTLQCSWSGYVVVVVFLLSLLRSINMSDLMCACSCPVLFGHLRQSLTLSLGAIENHGKKWPKLQRVFEISPKSRKNYGEKYWENTATNGS